jgi:RAQPRD family integrative conjugative element protein
LELTIWLNEIESNEVKMMKQLTTIFLLVSVFLFDVSFLHADVWAEREALAKVSKELESLKVLVNAAKSQSEPALRTSLDYDDLLSDIDKIRKGISTHLENRMEPVVPTKIDALKAQYTEHQ